MTLAEAVGVRWTNRVDLQPGNQPCLGRHVSVSSFAHANTPPREGSLAVHRRRKRAVRRWTSDPALEPRSFAAGTAFPQSPGFQSLRNLPGEHLAVLRVCGELESGLSISFEARAIRLITMSERPTTSIGGWSGTTRALRVDRQSPPLGHRRLS